VVYITTCKRYLDGEDESQRNKRLLSSGKLVHLLHLGVAAGKRDGTRKNELMFINYICRHLRARPGCSFGRLFWYILFSTVPRL